MILSFADAIDAATHAAILQEIAEASFVDGRETAGPALANVKKNEQIAHDHPVVARIAGRVLEALKNNERFLSAVYPNHLHSALVSRYRPGMEYGLHVDSALMGHGTARRADVSFTLFLSDPTSYDGGDLALESGSGEWRTKPPARCLVVYPTGQLHRVLPITRGERLAVVGWIQSFVRDGQERETLWDLAQARDALRVSEGQGSRAYELVNKTHANLLRRWSIP
jgi:PKHD-type hydroxylase